MNTLYTIMIIWMIVAIFAACVIWPILLGGYKEDK